MLKVDPAYRRTAKELLKFPWITVSNHSWSGHGNNIISVLRNVENDSCRPFQDKVTAICSSQILIQIIRLILKPNQ